MRQPRIRKQAGNLTGKPPKNDSIRTASPLYANFSFENYNEIVKRFTFAAHDLSRLKSITWRCSASQSSCSLEQVREDLNLAQVID